ncbi:ecotin [Alginatibacterium sediminis]|uniref:Ecotin n=1 Tax=Alginatibacterium sediminis TaxID=2164068 RepID=A0A420E702_9ALTE|nr:ecotin family protein [Alginatibacterium sediminis]RKF13255.1 ecotin [Alginatibacterium sediminis]
MHKISLALFGVISLSGIANADEKAADHMFAESLNGLQKYSVELPMLEDENVVKIELVVSKAGEYDCNERFISGSLDRKSLEGWGYSYYELAEYDKPMPQTLMACPEDMPKRSSASIVPGELRNYNSKIPLVVYLPEGYDLAYRVWSAGPMVGVE